MLKENYAVPVTRWLRTNELLLEKAVYLHVCNLRLYLVVLQLEHFKQNVGCC